MAAVGRGGGVPGVAVGGGGAGADQGAVDVELDLRDPHVVAGRGRDHGGPAHRRAVRGGGDRSRGGRGVGRVVGGEDQVVVVVVGARAARGGGAQVAEAGADGLEGPRGQGVGGGEGLGSRRGRGEGREERPGRTVRVGRVVEVEVVGRGRCPGPHGGGDPHRLTRGEGGAVRGGDHDLVVGFVEVERPGVAVRAGVVDGVGEVGLGAARPAAHEEGARVASAADHRALGRLQGGIVDRRARGGDGQAQARAVSE